MIQSDSRNSGAASSQDARLREIVEEFSAAWQRIRGTETPDLSCFLPESTNPLRTVALEALISVDLEQRWRRQQRAYLEWYLEQFIELGTGAELSPRLLVEEYRIRHRFGDQPALVAYQRRFPQQFSQMQSLLQGNPSGSNPIPTPPSAPSPSSRTVGSAPPPPPPPLPRTQTRADSSSEAQDEDSLFQSIGYRKIRCIGRGTFGEVWQAEAPGRVAAALKIIYRPCDHEDIKRELQSLEVVKKARHSFLLSTQAYWPLSDRLVIAMELADGTLHDRLNKCRAEGLKGIPPRELLDYFKEVAEAIDYLHDQNILHRDLKPANILLQGKHVKVADFGLARVLENVRSVQQATIGGTPPYMPPEVWDWQVGPASDLYSLAVTYVELRIGQRPFSGQSPRELEQEHRRGLPNLASLTEGEKLALVKALSKDPSDRHTSCQELVRELELAFAPPVPVLEPPRSTDTPKKTAPMSSDVPIADPVGATHRAPWDAAPDSLPALTPRSLPQPSPETIPPGEKGRGLGKVWLGILMLLLIAPAGWLFAYLFFTPRPDGGIPSVKLKEIPSLTLISGEAVEIRIGLDRQNQREPVEITFGELPQGINVSDQVIPGDQSESSLRLEATSDLPAGEATLLVKAKSGDLEDLQRLVIRCIPIPAGFKRAPDSKLTEDKATKLQYFDKLIYTIPDTDIEIVFLFIPSNPTPGSPNPNPGQPIPNLSAFYMMRDMVSVRQFEHYEEYCRKGGVQFDSVDVPNRSTGWAKTLPKECPALRVKGTDAFRFTQHLILGGKLPTAYQWAKAAGYYDNPDNRRGPYDPTWDLLSALPKSFLPDPKDLIAVGRQDLIKPPETAALPLGQAKMDVSIYGIRDMTGNGFEWTRSYVINFEDVQDFTTNDPTRAKVLRVSRSPHYPTPFQFQDFPFHKSGDRMFLATSELGSNLDPGELFGFRVVVEPPGLSR